MNQSTALLNRLRAAAEPHEITDWENRDGYYVSSCRVSKDDVPALIDMVGKWFDEDWTGVDEQGEDGGNPELLPVTAWRSLADLRSPECVEPLIEMLCESPDETDEWANSELPHVFGKIGEPAIAPLSRLAEDTDQTEFNRSIATESLRRIAEYHAETRNDVVARLTELMRRVGEETIVHNSSLLHHLVELRAVDAAEAIELAFSRNLIDVGVLGDWESVRLRLGVEGLGLEMPTDPHNSIQSLRQKMGIGIFSNQPIFTQWEVDPEAQDAYYQCAWDCFAESMEAQAVTDRDRDLGWHQSLLNFGVECRGEIVDEMTVDSVCEFVFNYIPRKVSTDKTSAVEIVFELTKFWQYLDRVYDLPNAESILKWLSEDGLAESLEVELGDSSNYGMAKSFVMSGMDAGYDMTTEEGMAAFMAVFHQAHLPDSARSDEPAAVPHGPSATVTAGPRVGRNDPCPCGSGKKFKKCCR